VLRTLDKCKALLRNHALTIRGLDPRLSLLQHEACK